MNRFKHPQFEQLTPTRVRVLKLLVREPGLTAAEVGKRLSPGLKDAAKVLEHMRRKRLVNLKYVIPVRYYVSTLGYEALAVCDDDE